MKFVIFGSCVTHDVFEYVDKSVCGLVRYFARSSLGSAYAARKVDGIDVSEIASPFQRGVVSADLNKEFKDFLARAEFDFLLYDPIDERFDLLVEGDRLCTLSNELRQVYEFEKEKNAYRLK